jgi:hypothetical protein
MYLKSIAGSYQTAMIYFLCWTFCPEKKNMNNYIPYVDIHLLMMDIGPYWLHGTSVPPKREHGSG